MTTRNKRLALVGLAVALVAGGQIVRARTGVDVDDVSIRAFVEEQGWLAPLIFVLLVVFRQFVLVPSAFLLAAGGLLFGAIAGSVLGAIGLFASSVFLFGLARGFAGEATRRRIAARYPGLDRSIESTGPFFVFVTIAYPLGLMTPVIMATGLSSMRLGPLLLAAALGGLLRAATFSLWGATLPDAGSGTFWIVTVGIAALILLPLAHPGLRRRLRGRVGAPMPRDTPEPENGPRVRAHRGGT